MTDRTFRILWTAAVVIGVAVCAFGLTMSVRQSTAYGEGCREHGGRWVNRHQDGGQCITPDGRVIVLNPWGETP
jgi:hypothetical protein